MSHRIAIIQKSIEKVFYNCFCIRFENLLKQFVQYKEKDRSIKINIHTHTVYVCVWYIYIYTHTHTLCIFTVYSKMSITVYNMTV